MTKKLYRKDLYTSTGSLLLYLRESKFCFDYMHVDGSFNYVYRGLIGNYKKLVFASAFWEVKT